MAATRLSRLPSVRDLIKLYNLTAKAQLSQNFILDKNITDKIVKTAAVNAKTTPFVVEIGPGPGLLSRSILDTGVNRLIAIEKDERFIPTLRQLTEASDNRFTVIQGDALKIDYRQVIETNNLQQLQQDSNTSEASHGYIMGNLPFNIASPLLLKFLHQQVSREGLFGFGHPVCMNLMFQKEVGDRITAKVSTSKRGRLSVMAQSICDVKTAYKVPATVFVPKPKVEASVIQFIPKNDSSISDPTAYMALENVLRYYFTKRRKTMGHLTQRLRKLLPDHLTLGMLEEIESIIDFGMRPEDVSTEQFCDLANLLRKYAIVQLPLN